MRMMESITMERTNRAIRKNVAKVALSSIMLAGLMFPATPVNAEALTKKDLEGLERMIENQKSET